MQNLIMSLQNMGEPIQDMREPKKGLRARARSGGAHTSPYWEDPCQIWGGPHKTRKGPRQAERVHPWSRRPIPDLTKSYIAVFLLAKGPFDMVAGSIFWCVTGLWIRLFRQLLRVRGWPSKISLVHWDRLHPADYASVTGARWTFFFSVFSTHIFCGRES